MKMRSLPSMATHDEEKEKRSPDVVMPQGAFVAAARRVCLLVVIMGSIWGIVFLVYQPSCSEEGFMATISGLRTLQINLIRYRTMVGTLPSETQGLGALARLPVTDPVPTSWHKLTDSSSLIDSWGHPYQYRNPAKKSDEGYDLFSMGKDGIEGTADDVYPD